MRRHAILIVNRAAGQGRRRHVVPQIVERLAAGGYRAEPRPTAGPGDATRLAREAAETGAAAVFALGGDGTLRETAVGLLGTRVPLGPIPGGTANVLTRALGLPRDPPAAADVVGRAEPRPLDVGLCGETPFLMMASAGLDAAVVHALHPLGARLLGRLGVALRGLGAWWSYGYPMLEVEARGTLHRASFAVLANIPLYGGPFRIAPASRPDDRRLDLLLFHGTGRAATLGFVRDVARGRHLARPDVEVLPIDASSPVTLAGPPEARFQIDGDPDAARPPVSLRLAVERLAVLAPAF